MPIAGKVIGDWDRGLVAVPPVRSGEKQAPVMGDITVR